MYTLQCRTVTKTRRFGPVNQTKTDGCLTGLFSGPKRRALAAFWSCQLDRVSVFCLVDRTKRGQSSAFWSGQQTRQTPISLCLDNRTKTPRFSHSSTLQGVHVRTKTPFWCVDSEMGV
ncbi:hypothetical protein Hanom_Chr14g01283421 [Helianthus anomalus]